MGLGGVLTVARVLGLLAGGGGRLWLLLNSDRIGTLKALGVTLLVFVVLGPVVQPWYLSWGLILLAPVALGRLRRCHRPVHGRRLHRAARRRPSCSTA